jgi:hypothetical protein
MRGDPAHDLARAVWTTVDRLPDDTSVLRFADPAGARDRSGPVARARVVAAAATWWSG